MVSFVILLFTLFVNTLTLSDSPERLLSFIIPCYNCAATVCSSIDSIYIQKLAIPFEVICTDDGSHDTTRKILLKYANRYSNFHVYWHEVNLGGAAARNTCVKHSKGDLIFCLDSDNILAPYSVQKLVDFLDQSQCQAAAFEEVRYFKPGHNASSWHYKAPDNKCDIHHIMSTNITPGSDGNYLYTRKSYDLAGGYPEESGATDTWRFAFRQHATGTKIAILPGTFYWHRLSDDSYWNRDQISGKNNKNYFASLLEFPELFTSDSLAFIQSWNPATCNFFHDLRAGLFQLINPEALEQLFTAYILENNHAYEQALTAYAKAIELGCNHERVMKRALNLKDRLH